MFSIEKMVANFAKNYRIGGLDAGFQQVISVRNSKIFTNIVKEY